MGELEMEEIKNFKLLCFALFKWIKKPGWNSPFSRKMWFSKTNAVTCRKPKESNSIK